MEFKHPKYYKELRKRNKLDQAISEEATDGFDTSMRPGPLVAVSVFGGGWSPLSRGPHGDVGLRGGVGSLKVAPSSIREVTSAEPSCLEGVGKLIVGGGYPAYRGAAGTNASAWDPPSCFGARRPEGGEVAPVPNGCASCPSPWGIAATRCRDCCQRVPVGSEPIAIHCFSMSATVAASQVPSGEAAPLIG